jgi:RNA polymerase sigma-70 factor (ECF subfamily)
MKSNPAFSDVVTKHWRRLYNFSYRMTLSHDDAAAIVRETMMRAYSGQEKLPTAEGDVEFWLLRIASHVLEKRLPKDPIFTWDLLDDTLRSEATRTDVVHALNGSQRDYMLWDLKQGCMTAVVNCLSPGERIAFVLATVLRLDDEQAARALGIKTSAYKVRLSRARKKVNDYLAPRCEHIDPRNPCHCPSRLGVALAKGFIAPPASPQAIRLRTVQPFVRQPERDVDIIFEHLPDLEPPTDLGVDLLREIESGTWEALRKRPDATSR